MTYRQIFEKARADGHEWADAALENSYQFGTAEDECKGDSLFYAVLRGFSWIKTSQGYEFWDKIWEQLPVPL